jgi:streptogrisin C
MIRSVLSLGLVAALLAVPAATSGPGGTPEVSQVRESVAYLTSAYHISTADAERRMRLQGDKDALTRRLAGALPGEYAGGWLDQRRGGVLTVAATNPERARRVIAWLPHGSEIQVLPAAYSLADLTRIERRAATRTGAYAQVDVVRNRVDLWTEQRSRVARAVSALGSDRSAVTVRTPPRETPTKCEVYECDPPIRAGISIGIGNAAGEQIDTCTSAFNIRDNLGRLYTSTAGHCFTEKPGAETIVSQKPAGGGVTLVADKRWEGSVVRNTTNPRRDFAFVRVMNTATWFPAGKPWNIDFFHCSAEPQVRTCRESLNKHRYRITGVKRYADMEPGEIVCMSGASQMYAAVKPGTRCGEITAKPNGGIRTNICAKPGDSGSPLFDQDTGVAYGIEASIEDPEMHAKCPPAHKQITNYTALSSALDAASTPAVTYRLIAN